MDIGARILRTFMLQLFVSTTIGSFYVAAHTFQWPGWVAIAGRIFASAALAGSALFFSWWTRNLGDGIPAVERTLRAGMWLFIVALAVAGAAIDWQAGVASLGLVLFAAGKTWPGHVDRFCKRLIDTIARPARVADVLAHSPRRPYRR